VSLEILEAVVEDLGTINSLIEAPKIKRHINDDSSMGSSYAFQSPQNILVIKEDGNLTGFFYIVPTNSITIDIHTCARDCTDKALAAHKTIEYLRGLGVKCITSHIPKYNKAALKFALATGFEVLGVLPKSYEFNGKPIDQYLVFKNI
jgi:L-amino acid N-acyltransferase YncA